MATGVLGPGWGQGGAAPQKDQAWPEGWDSVPPTRWDLRGGEGLPMAGEWVTVMPF